MNLWKLFPESIVHIKGILYLPYVAIPLFLFVFYALVKNRGQRKNLSIFLALTGVASVTMFFSFGSKIGLIIPPLLLIVVMLMPLWFLIGQFKLEERKELALWSIVSVAGVVHSISWVVWLFALGGS